MITIYSDVQDVTYTGTVSDVFQEFIGHLDLQGTSPQMNADALELRELWASGNHNTERARELERLFGVTVSADA